MTVRYPNFLLHSVDAVPGIFSSPLPRRPKFRPAAFSKACTLFFTSSAGVFAPIDTTHGSFVSHFQKVRPPMFLFFVGIEYVLHFRWHCSLSIYAYLGTSAARSGTSVGNTRDSFLFVRIRIFYHIDPLALIVSFLAGCCSVHAWAHLKRNLGLLCWLTALSVNVKRDSLFCSKALQTGSGALAVWLKHLSTST